MRAAYGPSSFDTARALVALAELAADEGDEDAEERALRDALGHGLVEAHPQRARIRVRLGTLLARQERLSEARSAFGAAADTLCGSGVPAECALALQHAGQAAADELDWRAAEAALRRSVEAARAARRSRSGSAADVATGWVRLAILLGDAGKEAEAKVAMGRAHALARQLGMGREARGELLSGMAMRSFAAGLCGLCAAVPRRRPLACRPRLVPPRALRRAVHGFCSPRPVAALHRGRGGMLDCADARPFPARVATLFVAPRGLAVLTKIHVCRRWLRPRRATAGGGGVFVRSARAWGG